MKRMLLVLAMVASLVALTACSTPAVTGNKPSGSGTSTAASGTPATDSSGTTPATEPRKEKLIGKLGKTTLFLHTTQVYDPAKIDYAKLDGEPSQNHFFKPTHDEGLINRDYPTYDAKTFKFLALPGGLIPPQDYYMFHKNGGTLNTALKSTGYKAVDIIDSGHIKILPNLYVGYYDFAWIPLNVITEYWSGNESMNQELWKHGNDYVIVGNSYDGGISLISPPKVTDVTQLANTTVGIMNPSFNIETLLNKTLQAKGLATEAAGGNVKVEMGTPGLVMNDLMAGRTSAVFAWAMYEGQLRKANGYKDLINWTQMGYGTKVPSAVLVVRRDILAKHPDIVQKVVQLNYDATKEALKLGDYKQPDAVRYAYYWTHFFGNPTGSSKPSLALLDAQAATPYLHDVYDYMVKCGYFKQQYPFGQLVDDSLYAKVKK